MRIDYRKLVILLLPTFLRRPVLMAWLRAMVYPLQQLHDRHQAARTQRLYELHHTSQICFIKDALNNEFGITDYATGFEIEDIDAPGNWIWVYDENVERFDDEQHMLFDEPTWIHDTSSILPPTSAFTVLVPKHIEIDETNDARIRSVVNKYRLASRTFEIVKRV
ncbi:MAG: hypothetical protein IJM74_03625 [Bacteroidales bacterium]|nr:hypothetical protein [Bacteroidales bacterium]